MLCKANQVKQLDNEKYGLDANMTFLMLAEELQQI